MRSGRRVILHVGAPKTGTTSLQVYLRDHREALLARGVLYPALGLEAQADPKHHWIVAMLMAGNERGLAERFDEVYREAGAEAHTILLSAEGIFSHWLDFPRHAVDALRAQAELFGEVRLWLWLRDPAEYLRSYYLQCLVNPNIPASPAYGRDLSVDEFLALDWVRARLRAMEIARSMREAFSDDSLFVFAYGGDIVARASDLLDLPRLRQDAVCEHVSAFDENGVGLLRALNRLQLSPQKKEAAVALAHQIQALAPGTPFRLTADEARRAREIADYDIADLERLDADSQARWRAEVFDYEPG